MNTLNVSDDNPISDIDSIDKIGNFWGKIWPKFFKKYNFEPKFGSLLNHHPQKIVLIQYFCNSEKDRSSKFIPKNNK